MTLSNRERTSLAEQAGEWVTRLEDDSSADCRAELVDWLRLSPHHIDEFLLAQATYRAFHGVKLEKIDLDGLLGEDATKVVLLHEREWRATRPTSVTSPPNRRRLVTLAAALGLVTMAAAWWLLPHSGDAVYETSVGEQRTVRLADGSLLYLNTHSRARVAYSSTARQIELIRGEALFDVAREQTRPFQVSAGGALVKALGTQFNVYRGSGSTIVSVIEGRVQVAGEIAATHLPVQAPGNAAPDATVLIAGDEVRVGEDGHVLERTKANAEAALAWRQRRLIFNGTTLAEAVDQFNRYNTFHIELADSALGRRQISGVFHADDPGTILTFLKRDPEIVVAADRDGAVVRRR